MRLENYLEATYLKTPSQAGISEEQTKEIVTNLIKEAITFNFKLVMIRAQYIPLAKELIKKANSNVFVGTVIGFHEGTNSIKEKLAEVQKAIDLGTDELDFVINYKAFKEGDVGLVKDEVLKGTEIGLKNSKVVKWIIETAALSNQQIASISSLIKSVVVDNFGIENAKNVFVKSSTGFYQTENNKPNGATFEAIKIMYDNANPLKIKAAGGVKTKNDALKMIALGVERIGTSSAKEIIEETKIKSKY